jgi:hypothetical protein
MSGVPGGTSVKKKRRKWEGLKRDGSFTANVGHGPIAALYALMLYCDHWNSDVTQSTGHSPDLEHF